MLLLLQPRELVRLLLRLLLQHCELLWLLLRLLLQPREVLWLLLRLLLQPRELLRRWRHERLLLSLHSYKLRLGTST